MASCLPLPPPLSLPLFFFHTMPVPSQKLSAFEAHQQFVRALESCSMFLGWFYPNFIGCESSYLRKVYTVHSIKCCEKKCIKRYACTPMCESCVPHVFVSTFTKQPDAIIFLRLILFYIIWVYRADVSFSKFPIINITRAMRRGGRKSAHKATNVKFY